MCWLKSLFKEATGLKNSFFYKALPVAAFAVKLEVYSSANKGFHCMCCLYEFYEIFENNAFTKQFKETTFIILRNLVIFALNLVHFFCLA